MSENCDCLMCLDFTKKEIARGEKPSFQPCEGCNHVEEFEPKEVEK